MILPSSPAKDPRAISAYAPGPWEEQVSPSLSRNTVTLARPAQRGARVFQIHSARFSIVAGPNEAVGIRHEANMDGDTDTLAHGAAVWVEPA